MLGLLYLLLCFTTGWVICSFAFPGLIDITKISYDKRKISFSPYLLVLPIWFIIGVLALTWPVYLIATLFSGSQVALAFANAIVMPMALAGSVLVLYRRHFKQKQLPTPFFCEDSKIIRLEVFLVAGVTLLAGTLMWMTFYVAGSNLYVGVSVFSDFSPHIGMIRSFSYGNNFPTAYSHFAGEDIKYHFMFQFLVGNLEFLGLRLDYAFNIPSILSFVSAFLLLYLLAVKISGKPTIGVLSCLFFAFRSSKSLFTYLADMPKGSNIIRELSENTSFIGDTPNENWGLWNLNVYANQRHLAFGLAVIFFVIIMFLPHLYAMYEELRRKSFEYSIRSINKGITTKGLARILEYPLVYYLKALFFTKEAWLVKDYKLSVASGILLGSLSFFHGAAVIGCLLILFVTAILSKRRLELLITAVIAVVLTVLQTRFFIEGSAVKPEYYFGFIADNKTVFGVLSYLDKLLGILPWVLIVAFCFEKWIRRYLILAFMIPLIFSFTVSLTVDVTVNHKYIMMSCILLGIIAATFIGRLFEKKDVLLKALGILLIIALTATGLYDYSTVIRKNRLENPIILDMNSPLTEWVIEKSDAKDIFLTSNYSINQFVLGGAMLYQGHQYYAWSAGYDTNYRDIMVRRMYEADTPQQLEELVKKNNIRFIVIDRDNRESLEYSLNEKNIRNTYQTVYEEGDGEWKISIFDTKLPVS
ncbi:hypothetical protein I5677_02195 [Mobilitalea sibirica]|uniref:Uncharacterized protein n=1 Tax=Mobilitalea sibirica TaxID=1462919 RepID=A0A8J7H0M9_9FIRM|nr:hypothetical protein [Mobilitalea sibirica]MBH1939703.1 hypothetical protein [Mobilitalea sibirica]